LPIGIAEFIILQQTPPLVACVQIINGTLLSKTKKIWLVGQLKMPLNSLKSPTAEILQKYGYGTLLNGGMSSLIH